MSAYRLVIVGPGDEVLDTIVLDGTDLRGPYIVSWLGGRVEQGMGSRHVVACAALPVPDEDDL